MQLTRQRLQRRIDAAQGRIPCDLVLKDVRFLDVFSCAWRKGDLSIVDGTIVGIEPGLKGKVSEDCSGMWAVPGFIDAHVHVESSLLLPKGFQDAVLPKGTTSAICDPHELANVMGVQGIKFFLESAERLAMDLWVMMSSCVPATNMETNGGGTIGAEDLVELSGHPKALGLAEVMNMPGVLDLDPEVLGKLEAFSHGPIDGHCPLLRGQKLSAYASAGISSCHESSELEEAREKLSKGISVWIREGSVAKDLDALIPLMNVATSTSLGFCTDDRNPLDIACEGHLDHLIRKAIHRGVAPETVYRCASWSVARHYGLISGPHRVGALAPGYAGDVVILGDEKACQVEKVLKRGRWVSEIEGSGMPDVRPLMNTIRVKLPEAHLFEGPQGKVHVIGVLEGKIITEHLILKHDAPGVARLAVLERYGRSGEGKGPPLANGYVFGFGEKLRGAIASSVGHDSHNLIVVGDRGEEMRTAVASLIEVGGGFSVVQNGKVLARLSLPYGGLMTGEESKSLQHQMTSLKDASRAIGCILSEPFLQLAFLSLPVIPALKLTDRGLVDVNSFRLIDVRAS